MIKLNIDYPINVTRSETNFDKACDSAYSIAVRMFQIDEDGNSPIEGWERCCCSIQIEFKGYVRSGCQHVYSFTAIAIKHCYEID